MENIFTFALSVFMGLIAMMNPIANIPAFLGLVNNYPTDKKRKIILKGSITAFAILLGFILLGKFIFSVFDITIPAFKITGGIFIFYIGFKMLNSKDAKPDISDDMDCKNVEIDESIAISPLAMPFLAGPGAIVSTMSFVSDHSIIHMAVVIVIVALVVFINYISLFYGDYIAHKLGHNIMNVLNKLMGLILAIMATGLVIAGLQLLMPRLFLPI